MRKKRPLPKWYLEEPMVTPVDYFYYESFWDLSSTRLFELGPIPWNRIIEYGYYIGLDDVMLEAFTSIIKALDTSYLDWSRDQRDRQRTKKTANTGSDRPNSKSEKQPSWVHPRT